MLQSRSLKLPTPVVLTSLKTKLKLTDAQAVLMAKHAGIARFTFNWGLGTWIALYSEGLKPNALTLKQFFNNHVKSVYPWIKEQGICQKVTQYAFEHLGRAFENFLAGKTSYPKFKKKGQHDSFTIDASGRPIAVGGTRLKLPTIGWVSTIEGLPHVTTKAFTISFSQEVGNWYISFTYEIEPEVTPKSREFVGVDLGVKQLATLSSGVVIANPQALRKARSSLGRLQRQLRRKHKGSKRYHRQKLRLATADQRVKNIRLDATHKATTYICKNHAVVAIEDLNVSGMMANHKLAGAVADANFYEFRRQIEYKAQRYGSKLVLVSRWYPSTQLCSNCGEQQPMSLSARVYECSACGFRIDRDFNASVNLENYARVAKPSLDTEG
ncbi:RNA-guided endonuclease InsQ/TnpB family protein [Microseira wollei]|uniref:Transposase n=1 Tax=Microseira wollei NIES-4236 TaxID=2530354 RepID=A0AAV3XMJ5_9CYAN|nr:transposase [Microseira wollei]GET42811.1 transposase [Microseira wollei NIES-4236]